MKKILDKIPRPPGAVPAKAQAWLLVCLTVAIAVTLVSFPGEEDRRNQEDAERAGISASAGAPAGVGVVSVENAARRMREEAARKAERRLQTELGVPAPRQDGLPHSPQPVPAATLPDREPDGPYRQELSVEHQIEQEERIRRYRSLRTPVLVQSHRTDSLRSPASEVPEPTEGGRLRIPEELGETIRALDLGPSIGLESRTEIRGGPLSAAETYVLREGEFLEAVLATRLSGEFVGPVNAMVSADVYDRRRQHLLVPRGTRALGQASRVEDWGQSRLAVLFHRLVLPDGTAIDLRKSVGLNQIGETGLKDRVDRRYAATFAAAGAVGVLAGLSQAVSPQDAFTSRLGSARLSAGAGLSRAAERILDRYINRLPKVTVREGHRIRIYLTQDLQIPAYDTARKHRKGD